MKRASLEKLIRFLQAGKAGVALELKAAERRELAAWLKARLPELDPPKPDTAEARGKRRGAGAKARSRRGAPPPGALAVLYSDGASRGNPGPAALGFVISLDGEELFSHGETLGRMTNNQAEYRALLAGLEAVHRLGFKRVEMRLDSELVVRQLEGRYKVKHAALKPLYQQALQLLSGFADWRARHVPRAENSAADALANEALDSLQADSL